MAIEVLTVMREHKAEHLPVYENGDYIASISYKELLNFLNYTQNGNSVYFHKLNFDLGSALIVIREMRYKIHRRFLELTRVAIIALALMSIALVFFKSLHSTPEAADQFADMDAGVTRAELILANGSRISLDGAKQGILATEPGLEIIKTGSRQIAYKVKPEYKGAKFTGYTTIVTPNGGQYQILLADGTKIWLDAASAVKFPATFSFAEERKVFLSGEAYFEVAKEKSRHFVVSTKGQDIEVLGTHFNVSAYNDENMVKTTLLEGSVKVWPKGMKSGYRILKPSQQSVLTGTDITVKAVDPEEAVAWKNGAFLFRNETLESIMLKVSRWYNVKVVYQDKKIGKQIFGGMISRSEKVTKVLKMLELTGDVHFKVQGRKVLVRR